MNIVEILLLIALVLSVELSAKASMSNPNQICFTPEPGDSAFFATSVAINNKYLAGRIINPDSLSNFYRFPLPAVTAIDTS